MISRSQAVEATPSALGFRMPAEWEPQEAVWLSWPHNRETWPGRIKNIPAKFAEIVATISRFQIVRVNLSKDLERGARRLCERSGAVMERVEFFAHPTNDSWCRDHGPIFIKNDETGEVAVTDWKYNAWGGKYPPFDKDNRIPARIAKAFGMHRFPRKMILEGGSIDVNGSGLLLTTEACLLNKNRNPRLSKQEIEQQLIDYLGVRKILWLGDGIEGDDTDGHIDDLTRFYSRSGIVTVVERNRRDSNYRLLAENLERLQSLRTLGGRRFTICELPMPKAVFIEGQRMPASYANFLIINGAVLVPTFRQPRRDGAALEVLRGCFPNREIIGIDCSDLIWGLGTLHCISQQQPA